MRDKIRYFYNMISRNKLTAFSIFLLLLLCWNIVANYRLCNFRSRRDYTDMMSFIRSEVTPGSTIISHMYEEHAIGAFERLGRTVRIGYPRHSNNLNSELLGKHSEFLLPAFLDFKNRSKDHTMFYVTDRDIDEKYTLVPVPTDYPLRFIMGDVANLQLYHGFERRQLYYALPKESAECINPTGQEIIAANFDKHKGFFLNNWEVSGDKSFIRPKSIGAVANILVCKPKDVDVTEVVVRILVTLNPAQDPASKIKRADLAFYLNNAVIKNQTVIGGEEAEVVMHIPEEMLTGKYNFLALVPFYNSVNSFYPSPLYPVARGTMPKGEFPYLVKSISIREQK